jgi:hypothetical protein
MMHVMCPVPRSDFLLNPHQRADARAALKLLASAGISLEEAARIALDRKRPLVRITLSDACDRFLLSRVRKVTRRGAALRPATLAWYEQFLNPLARDFGAGFIDTVTRASFAEWIHALQVGETARTSIARAARAVWRWCLVQNPPMVTEDVTIGLTFSRGTQSETSRMVLTVEQTAAILHAAGPKRSAFALMLFAGIRPEEVAGRAKEWLRWEHVNLAERWIRIPAHISKTTKTRLLEHLPDTVWHWLTPGALTARISPVSDRTLREFAQHAAGIASWPYDCFRHTAASYLLAFARDAGRVAEWIGHEGRPTLLHQTYRGQLTLGLTQINHDMAVRFLGVLPSELARARLRLLATLRAGPVRPARRSKPRATRPIRQR